MEGGGGEGTADGEEGAGEGIEVSLSSSAAIHVSFAYRECHSLSLSLSARTFTSSTGKESQGERRRGLWGIADWLSRCGIFALSFLRFCDNSRFINCLCVSFAITLQNTLKRTPPHCLRPCSPHSHSPLDLRRKQKCWLIKNACIAGKDCRIASGSELGCVCVLWCVCALVCVY